jgi:hypothetical protein
MERGVLCTENVSGEELSIEEEGSAHRFYPKSHIPLGEAIDFPRSVCERFVDELPGRFLRSASEVIVMQPIRHSHLVNLPLGLDFSRLR